MARKNQSVLTVEPNNQKSNNKVALWQSFTFGEFKVLDAYLSRIDSNDPNTMTVTFSKNEIEQILGVQDISESELRIRLVHLFQPVPLDTSDGGFVLIHLFNTMEFVPDENGEWIVQIQSTEYAQKYFFNTDDIGFYRFLVKCVGNIISTESYVLFQYLIRNQFLGTWRAEVENLKKILFFDEKNANTDFTTFANHVLNRCQTELAEQSGMIFSYKPIYEGCSVSAFEFSIDPKSVITAELKRFTSPDEILADL